MVLWLWLTRLLLLICLAKESISLHFFPESEGRSVSRDEAEDFFDKLDQQIAKRNLAFEALNPSNITKRDNVFDGLGQGFGNNRPGSHAKRSSPCITERGDGTGSDIDITRSECQWSINAVLNIKEFSSLQTLSADILNGEDYMVTAREGDKLIAKHRKESGQSNLPGIQLEHNSRDLVTLTLDLNPPKPVPKKKKAQKKRREGRSTKEDVKAKRRNRKNRRQRNRQARPQYSQQTSPQRTQSFRTDTQYTQSTFRPANSVNVNYGEVYGQSLNQQPPQQNISSGQSSHNQGDYNQQSSQRLALQSSSQQFSQGPASQSSSQQFSQGPASQSSSQLFSQDPGSQSSSQQYNRGSSRGSSNSNSRNNRPYYSSQSQSRRITQSTRQSRPYSRGPSSVEMPLNPPSQQDTVSIKRYTTGMGSGSGSKSASTKTVLDVAISITAKGKINLGGMMIGPKQTITLTKKIKEDSFGIEFGMPNDIDQFITKLQGYMDQISNFGEYIPQEVTEFATTLKTKLGLVKTEVGAWTFTGAFDKDKNYQISLSRGDTTISGHQISALTFIISMAARETNLGNAGFTFFANFVTKPGGADLFALLRGAFGSSNILTEVLDNINSEKWCLLATNKKTTYINVVKKDVMTQCLGDGVVSAFKDTKTSSQYTSSNTPLQLKEDEVIAGLHFYAKVQFESLLKKCWENTEQNARPKTFTDVKTLIAMYASITRPGLTFRLPGGPAETSELMQSCMAGLLSGAPSYLSSGQIKIDQFEFERNPPVFKIGVMVEPADENKRVPGTKIELNSLKVVLNRKTKGNDVTWDVTGETEIAINEATATVSVKKVDSKYTIGVAIGTFRLSDAAEGFNVQEYPDIMKSLGIKDFNLEYKYLSQRSYSISITGRPLIVNYDDLHVNVMAETDEQGVSKWSVGLYMNGANFDGLMKRVAGNEAISLKWLDGLKAVVVFSWNKDGLLKAATAQERSELAAAPATSTSAESGSVSNNSTVEVVKEEASLVSRGKRDDRGTPRGYTRRRPPTSSRPRAEDSPSRISGGSSSGSSSSSSSKKPAKPTIEFPNLAEPFVDMKFVNGLTFGVSWEIPNDEAICEDNGICTWLVENLGKRPEKSHLMISGAVAKTWFTLKASLKTEIFLINKARSKLKLEEISLIIAVGVEAPKFMIEAKMSYEDENIGATGGNILNFVGTIEATPISIQMTFSMEGYVFPSDYLGIGNVKLGIGYSFTSGLPTMMFGASVMLGKLNKQGTGTAEEYNSHAIIVKGYFGINPGNPMKNFLYGSINKLTINAVCEAFDLRCDSIPGVLKNTGFPSGITASYAGSKTEIPGVGEVEQGVYIKGTLDFFGLECYCELGKADQTWTILIEMSPINWADGWIQVLRSEGETDMGPKVEAAFGGGEAELKIQGFVNALNYIKASVNITITRTKLSFVIKTFIVPNLIEAEIEFMVNYDASNAQGEDRFKFVATVSTSGMVAKLKEAIKGFIDAMHDRAVAIIDIARKALHKAEAKVEEAKKKVEKWKESIDKWKNDLRAQKKALQEEANRSPPCVCPLVCMPFLDWDPKCWKIWGYWVGCPFWNDCFTKIKDPFCLANCALNAIVSALTRWAKQAVLSITMLIAEGAKGLLGLADGVFAIADKVLETAKKAFQWIEDGLKKLKEWAKAKVDELFNAFKLEYLKLSARLTADYSPCVGFDIKLIIDKKPYQRDGEVCLDVKSFIKAFVRLILSDTDPSTAELQSESEKLDEAEKKNEATTSSEAELEEEEKKTENTITEEEAKDFDRDSVAARKRSDIPGLHKWKPFLEKIPKVPSVRTAEEMEMIKLANAPVEKYYAEDDEDPHVRSIIENGAWSELDHKQPVGVDATVTHDETAKEKRSLNFDEKMTPCARMKRALSGYADLTDGMITYAKGIKDTSTGMETFDNARNEKLKQLRSRIEAADAKHNMTIDDREEAYFMYNKLYKGHEDMVRRSNVAISREDSYALPVIRRQINSLLKKANGKNFIEFTELMHANAVQGYKRSGIPHPSDVEGEKMLSKIKKDIQSIVTDEDSNIVPMSSRLAKVKKSIIAMRTYTKQCNKA